MHNKGTAHPLVALAASMALNTAVLIEQFFMSAAMSAFKAARSNGKPNDASCVLSGMTPPQYFWHKLTARFTRLPRISASSELCMTTTEDSEKFRSAPYVIDAER